MPGVDSGTIARPAPAGLAARLREIGRSWLAMKPWVKAWLFFLNGVFLAALAFRDPLARWTLAAYLASGPLLLAMMLAQRGLTRLLGLAHLIPWLPLLAYTSLRLSGDAAGPRITPGGDPALFAWALVLGAATAVCLAFDAFDVVRWIRGERFVLGTPEAARAGASRLTWPHGPPPPPG